MAADAPHPLADAAPVLLSALFGILLAGLCLIPLSNKVTEFLEREKVRLKLIQEGIIDLYNQENPVAIEIKLESLSGTGREPRRPRARSKPRLLPAHRETSLFVS
jgi:flagellar motor component MotA